MAKRNCPSVGIGVGLYRDYGAAQWLYCRRGYLPDGNGLMYANKMVAAGDFVRVDDELVTYLVKELGEETKCY